MIDYFCFVIKKETMLQRIRQIIGRSTEDKFERFPALFEREILVAREARRILVFDEAKNMVTDIDGIRVECLKGKRIFPRTHVEQTVSVIAKIQELGGDLISDYDDYSTITNWHRKIPTKRGIVETTFGDFLAGKHNDLGDKVFLKTIVKDFSSVCVRKNGEWVYEKTGVPIAKRVKKAVGVMVSPVVKIARDDDYIEREWRNFIIDDEPFTMNNYWTHEPLEEGYVIDWIRAKAAELKGIMPSCYCMDVMEYEADGGLEMDLVELNPPIATGADLIPLAHNIFGVPFEDGYLRRARRQGLSVQKRAEASLGE